jgi:SAM-dependent methyltransferase
MTQVSSPLEALSDEYAAWWIDLLGEHNHIGGVEATKWLLDRAHITAEDRVLDAGAFVGGAARMIARRTEATVVATDVNADFLVTGSKMSGGELVKWVAGSTHKLPFADGSFTSAWCLDSYIAPRELSRVTAAAATLCLCCEVPEDSRGGVESFIEEWGEFGWEMSAHRQLSSDATQTWRMAEGEMVRRRPHFEARYGKRGYIDQLDMLASMVRAYEVGEQGHGLFVFSRKG